MDRRERTFDESQRSPQRLELRQLAQQGDEAAIAYFLKLALAHEQTTAQSFNEATSRDTLPQVQVCLNGDWIKVVLHFDEAHSVAPGGSTSENVDRFGEKWVIKTLIDQELLQLHLPRLRTIELQIYQIGAVPLWTEHFVLGSQAQVLITHSASKEYPTTYQIKIRHARNRLQKQGGNQW